MDARYNAAMSMLASFLRRKKWVWVGIASDDVWISLAVVRMGYASSAFAFVYDLAAQRMIADVTLLGPPGAAEVGDDHANLLSRFDFRGNIAIAAAGTELAITGKLGAIELDVTIETGAPSVSANARVGEGLYSFTEKRLLAATRGRVVVGGRSISLDGALGGWDYTNGMMPRHTRWRWAFGMGRDRGGSPIGFNLTQGFVGEAECVAADANRTYPLGEPRIVYDEARPESPWRLLGDGIDLVFTPGGVHAQRTNLGLVRSKFLQPAGLFHGSLRIGGETVEVDRLAGVVEDQDVLW